MAGLTSEQLQKMGAKPISSGGGVSVEQLNKIGAKPITSEIIGGKNISYEYQQEPKSVGGFVGNIVKGGAETVGGIVKTIANPVETIKNVGKLAAGGITQIPGIKEFYDKNATAKGKEILEEERNLFNGLVSMYKDRYGGENAEEVVKNISNTAYEDPVGFLMDLSVVLGGTGAGLKIAGTTGKVEQLVKAGQIASRAGEIVNPFNIVKGGIQKATKIGTVAKTEAQAVESVLGGQAKKFKIPQYSEGLKSIDTAGIKTYKDLSGRLQSKINSNISKVDEFLSKYTETFKPKDLTKTFGEGKNLTKQNSVNDAISGLKQAYKSSNESEKLSKILNVENKFKSTGLTSQELNNLAKEYGSEFKRRAFGKGGEQLTSTSSQGYENTRKGVKEAARGTIPDNEAKILDEQAGNMISTKDLVDKIDNAIFQLQGKLKQTNILQKIGGTGGKAFNLLTGKSIEGALRGVFGFKESRTMDLIEIQNQLQNNLKELNRLNGLSTEKVVNEVNKLLTGSYYLNKPKTILDELQ